LMMYFMSRGVLSLLKIGNEPSLTLANFGLGVFGCVV